MIIIPIKDILKNKYSLWFKIKMIHSTKFIKSNLFIKKLIRFESNYKWMI